MKSPENYQQLKELAAKQTRLAADLLHERAENLERLAAALPNITNFETQPRLGKVLPLLGNVIDYDDDANIPALRQITTNWPYIDSQPGEGYW